MWGKRWKKRWEKRTFSLYLEEKISFREKKGGGQKYQLFR